MKVLWDGLLIKNPVFVLLLGLVPAVAVASTAERGWLIGLATAVIFLVITVLDSLFLKAVPGYVRPIVKFGVLVVLTVFLHSLLLGWNPQFVAQLGIFLPLIVANRMLFGEVSSEQSSGQVIMEAVGQSLGLILALVVIGAIREVLGFGTIFGTQLFGSSLPPLATARTVPGGMIIVGLLLALTNKLTVGEGELHD